MIGKEKILNYNNKEMDDLNHPELVTLACLSLGGLKKKIQLKGC